MTHTPHTHTRVCILITFENYHILFLRQKYVDCKLKSAETNSKFIVIGFVGSLNIIILNNIYIYYTSISVCRCVVCVEILGKCTKTRKDDDNQYLYFM